ncbi:lipopolysaccharide export system protein LptA [Geothermobacter ehrlichii]|uniref:Lipopolysaccharide export system protein LptA n=1 Tax=Geothermobacter ehrlichii TaxID=213224 RepID=A0A5D3WKF9_9BACT|nr:lipopolysaccharide transport periplasmic protein LptA [Geothermobacter ehrlichii]TYO99507.1 lipopolysaccharide export system protein LptA [Geothermobacter ehrlichii]
MKRRFCLIFLVCLLAVPCPVPAADAFNRDAPLEITSDRLEADDVSKTVVFIGHVVGRQDDLTIHAGRLTVHYRQGRQIRTIVAEEDVRIIQGERVATGQKAVFDRQEATIVLTGDPRVNQGKDFVAGERITVFLDEKRSLVEGGEKERVRALFHPRSKDNGQNPAR